MLTGHRAVAACRNAWALALSVALFATAGSVVTDWSSATPSPTWTRPATSVNDLAAKATALRQALDAAQARADAAAEAYDRAEGEALEAISAQRAATDAVAQAGASTAAAHDALAAQARAVYESGGPLAAAADVLRSGNPADLVDRLASQRRAAQRVGDRARELDAANARITLLRNQAGAQAQAALHAQR
ncbi:MAG TPA: hypothetical protein VG818_05420, partial [Gemmatimonadaceae bacterium]|nr:hypothetical protein [Gemmatimonadaceae bacterium]